jgi:hypothetical protein
MFFDRNGRKIAALRSREECALREVNSRKALSFNLLRLLVTERNAKGAKAFRRWRKGRGTF